MSYRFEEKVRGEQSLVCSVCMRFVQQSQGLLAYSLFIERHKDCYTPPTAAGGIVRDEDKRKGLVNLDKRTMSLLLNTQRVTPEFSNLELLALAGRKKWSS